MGVTGTFANSSEAAGVPVTDRIRERIVKAEGREAKGEYKVWGTDHIGTYRSL